MNREHIVGGEFQSDKYPWCKRGFVPLKLTDPGAQRVLWDYAQQRRSIDPEFADDLEWALRDQGYYRFHIHRWDRHTDVDFHPLPGCLKCGVSYRWWRWFGR